MYDYNKKLKERARQMRREMTPQEGLLWHSFLKRYPVKILRQRTIDSYIVDFYCSKAKLVIEIDGSHHFEENQKEYDEIRTKFLNSLGMKVIRFTNDEVKHNFDSVCLLIDKNISERINQN